MEDKYHKYRVRYLNELYSKSGGATEGVPNDVTVAKTLQVLSEKGFVSFQGIHQILSRHPSLVMNIIQLYRNSIQGYANDPTLGGNISLFTTNDFKIVFYHAHQLLEKYTRPHSTIVSIGESPDKLVWAMECLVEREGQARQLNFIHLAISKVGCTNFFTGIKRGNDLIKQVTKVAHSHFDQVAIKFNYSILTKLNRYTDINRRSAAMLFKNQRNLPSDYLMEYIEYFPDDKQILGKFKQRNLDNLHDYFTELNLDYNTILANPGLTVFYDRSETANSIVCFCFLLRALGLSSGLSPELLTRAILKIRIIGIDGSYDQPDYLQYKLFIIRYTIGRLFPELTREQVDTIYQFYEMKVHNEEGFDVIESHLKTIPHIQLCGGQLYSSVCCTHKLINIMSLPERSLTNARCIRSIAMEHLDISHITRERHADDRKTLLAEYVRNPVGGIHKPGEHYTYCNVYRFLIVLMMSELETWITTQLIPNANTLHYLDICLNHRLVECLAEVYPLPSNGKECFTSLLNHYHDTLTDNMSIFRINPLDFKILSDDDTDFSGSYSESESESESEVETDSGSDTEDDYRTADEYPV